GQAEQVAELVRQHADVGLPVAALGADEVRPGLALVAAGRPVGPVEAAAGGPPADMKKTPSKSAIASWPARASSRPTASVKRACREVPCLPYSARFLLTLTWGNALPSMRNFS